MDQLRTTTPQAGTALYLVCPVCASDLTRSVHDATERVIVHRCAADGAWLDGKDARVLSELLQEADVASLREFAEERHRRDAEGRLRAVTARAPIVQQRVYFIFDIFDLF